MAVRQRDRPLTVRHLGIAAAAGGASGSGATTPAARRDSPWSAMATSSPPSRSPRFTDSGATDSLANAIGEKRRPAGDEPRGGGRATKEDETVESSW